MITKRRRLILWRASQIKRIKALIKPIFKIGNSGVWTTMFINGFNSLIPNDIALVVKM